MSEEQTSSSHDQSDKRQDSQDDPRVAKASAEAKRYRLKAKELEQQLTEANNALETEKNVHAADVDQCRKQASILRRFILIEGLRMVNMQPVDSFLPSGRNQWYSKNIGQIQNIVKPDHLEAVITSLDSFAEVYVKDPNRYSTAFQSPWEGGKPEKKAIDGEKLNDDPKMIFYTDEGDLDEKEVRAFLKYMARKFSMAAEPVDKYLGTRGLNVSEPDRHRPNPLPRTSLSPILAGYRNAV